MDNVLMIKILFNKNRSGNYNCLNEIIGIIYSVMFSLTEIDSINVSLILWTEVFAILIFFFVLDLILYLLHMPLHRWSVSEGLGNTQALRCNWFDAFFRASLVSSLFSYSRIFSSLLTVVKKFITITLVFICEPFWSWCQKAFLEDEKCTVYANKARFYLCPLFVFSFHW